MFSCEVLVWQDNAQTYTFTYLQIQICHFIYQQFFRTVTCNDLYINYYTTVQHNHNSVVWQIIFDWLSSKYMLIKKIGLNILSSSTNGCKMNVRFFVGLYFQKKYMYSRLLSHSFFRVKLLCHWSTLQSYCLPLLWWLCCVTFHS